jgi:hypothetical protein
MTHKERSSCFIAITLVNDLNADDLVLRLPAWLRQRLIQTGRGDLPNGLSPWVARFT